jgi:hypothetical protein
MAPITSIGSLDDIRRKVIRELVDLDLGIARRRLTRRQRWARGVRRGGGRVLRLGRFGS